MKRDKAEYEPSKGWQKCPICNGYGTVGKEVTTCTICDGEKIIHIETGFNPTGHHMFLDYVIDGIPLNKDK